MAFDGLLITEIFHSLQGESSLSGVPFAFIRLSGCNLRCTYCDSSYAFKGGEKLSIPEILKRIEPFDTSYVLLTGGEPLMQRNTPQLAKALVDLGYLVSIETHGEVSILPMYGLARIVLDIKTPSSGMCRGGFMKNLPFLTEEDEVKFVIASKEDYEWAKDILDKVEIPTAEILFSVAEPAENSPGVFPGVTHQWLAESILKDRLPVRFQIQLHKHLWGRDRRGV